MTLEEIAKQLLVGEVENTDKFMYIVKFCDGQWDGGFSSEIVLPLETRDELVKECGSELEGYMTLSDFHIEDMKKLGASDFALHYKTALVVAMKSRITMHKRPK